MAQTESRTGAEMGEAPSWSARNLPEPTFSGRFRFSVLAVATGLVAIVLASALSGPIRTAGTKMEPARFQSNHASPATKIASAP